MTSDDPREQDGSLNRRGFAKFLAGSIGVASLFGTGVQEATAQDLEVDDSSGVQKDCKPLPVQLNQAGEPYEALNTAENTTQVNEIRTEDHVSFFNHTFARPGAPDDKNWSYNSSDISKVDSELQLTASSTTLETKQRGNYPPGTEAIPGCAFRLDAAPTAGRGEAGYFDSNNGFGGGEDASDSYVFIRKNGTTHRVYRSNWNGYVPSGRVWVSSSPVITRMPHLFYGGGAIAVKALVHEDGEPVLRTLHTFTPSNVPSSFGAGPPFNQPNLPIQFETSSLSGASVFANAAHYEYGEQSAENRTNGEHFTNVSVATTGWTPLISWQKRSGWDMVNVKPLKITASSSSADVKLELQLDSTLSSTSFGLPENTSSDESAVEVDTSGSLDAVGERRWVGYAAAGQGSKSGGVESTKLDFNLPVGETVTLAAQAVGSTADVSGVVAWEEFF